MRSGFVGLAGRPNVGKSTLTNALCGAHVAIVSDKPQTTRQRALGVVHGDDFQIVLVDLPGFQKPFDALTRRMQRSVDDEPAATSTPCCSCSTRARSRAAATASSPSSSQPRARPS